MTLNETLVEEFGTPPVLRRGLIAFGVVFAVFACIMIWLDPNQLFRSDARGKVLPNNHLYHYNYLKHVRAIDAALLGSSAVNYIPLSLMFGDGVPTFSMGIESSGIHEQVVYGRLLAGKGVKKIVFFITFYSLSPSRPVRIYFKQWVVRANHRFVDFFDQYFSIPGWKSARDYYERMQSGSSGLPLFLPNGQRSSSIQNQDPNAGAPAHDGILAQYLAGLSLDPNYYSSTTFLNPESTQPAIDEIAGFQREMSSQGIEVKFVLAPEHRTAIALIYKMGLGPTFEETRRKLAQIAEFSDPNLAIEFTSNDRNFWDTHHVRNASELVTLLQDPRYIQTKLSVDQRLDQLRPTPAELAREEKLRTSYTNLQALIRAIADDKHKPIAP